MAWIFCFGLLPRMHSQDFPDDFFNAEKIYLTSGILNTERLLFIYLPSDYQDDTERAYPVHYLCDAPVTSNIYFDLLRLHAYMNYVPESIVVGLSSDDRNAHLHPEEGADEYLQFIEREVIPFIEDHYRTSSFRILAGHSLGGDFTVYSMLKAPDLFNAYIAGSPGPIDPLMNMLEGFGADLGTSGISGTSGNTFLYASTGSEDFTDPETFNRFKEKLKATISDKVDYHFEIHPGEDHISNIVINYQSGIRKLFSDWQFELPSEPERPVSEILKAHYDRLELKYGYRPEIGEWEVIFPVMDTLARRGDFENAIDILLYCVELYPDSDQAYAFLAKAHFDTGQKEQGLEFLDKSLEINPENPFALQMKMMIENQ